MISEGLNVGDKIVVAGQSRLFDGALVDVKPPAPPNVPVTDASVTASQAKTGSAD